MGDVPETIVVHSPTLNEDEINLLCHSLQISLKLRSFPHSLSGAQKVQIWTVHVCGETLSIKCDQTAIMTLNGR